MRLLEEFVVQLAVVLLLADVGAHANAVQHEVNLAAQLLLRARKQRLQLLRRRSIGRDDGRVALLAQLVDFAHAHGQRRIGEHEAGAFGVGPLGHFPGNGLVVERAGNDADFAGEEVIRH